MLSDKILWRVIDLVSSNRKDCIYKGRPCFRYWPAGQSALNTVTMYNIKTEIRTKKKQKQNVDFNVWRIVWPLPKSGVQNAIIGWPLATNLTLGKLHQLRENRSETCANLLSNRMNQFKLIFFKFEISGFLAISRKFETLLQHIGHYEWSHKIVCH